MSACFTASPSSLSFITLADVFRDHVMPTVSVGSPAHAARNLELLFKTDIPEPQVNKNVEGKYEKKIYYLIMQQSLICLFFFFREGS